MKSVDMAKAWLVDLFERELYIVNERIENNIFLRDAETDPVKIKLRETTLENLKEYKKVILQKLAEARADAGIAQQDDQSST